ncbi:hypothetical protein BCL76_12163 [Streptomyces sp. CG 926]|uniref:hypothetical protein n=1 Tax=Streptomyces sp. CG 926 TaxID=1882405 RepID=UPI000D6AD789|nr:hypothetical protein [Streptomyces sp. CG 926]PWK63384.1 hypothetical protein BCL76_12163 [Streptomyces sp. CG 926]
MDGSLAAIVGAAIGAIGGLTGGWLSVVGQSRQRREQQRADHQQWRDEMRRDAYASYLAATRELNAACWKVADQLVSQASTSADWEAALAETHDAWARFSTGSSAVAVAGPRSAADEAAALHRAMRRCEMIVVDWARSAIRGGVAHVDDHRARFASAADAKQAPLAAFQRAAREALGTEH